MATSTPTIASITRALLEYVPPEVRSDLAYEDVVAAAEVHFDPVGLRSMPAGGFQGGDCSTDGYYDALIDPSRPWIIYADEVHPARKRFTIVHEIGHHLLVTVAESLLDDLDRLGGSPDKAALAEESVCHRFAGHVLVPDEQLDAALANQRITPTLVKSVHDECEASWEAIAVRISERMAGAGAVILIREPGLVGFCASSAALGSAWWRRGTTVDPDGPLQKALHLQQTAVEETYRFGLGYPQRLFCDTLPIHEGLAVAVLSDRRSDGGLSLIEQPEPAWKERAEFCEWHPGVERDVGWCANCRGRCCSECGRCGCTHPIKNPLCPRCHLLNPMRSGAEVCRDCEADL